MGKIKQALVVGLAVAGVVVLGSSAAGAQSYPGPTPTTTTTVRPTTTTAPSTGAVGANQQTTSGALPRTGSDFTMDGARIGLALVAAGGIAVVVAKRPRGARVKR